MNARPEIDFFGVVRASFSKRGWRVGEVFEHKNRGEQIVRPAYVRNGVDAILAAVARTRFVAYSNGLPVEVVEALSGFSTAYASDLLRMIDDFPTTLPYLRAAANLSRHELALRAGASYETVRRIERGSGRPSLRMLLRLLRALES